MLATGSRLGPYEILAPLGAGGMGEVYRALDPRLSREVAIKVLPERLREHAEALARFEREARSVAALSHTNILAVHDIGRHEGVAFTVMELLDGETLRDRLRAGALPLHKALDIAIQIARGLGAAHGRGVVHRDLKPENVFVTRDGQVKILDFGLARIDEPGESSPASADSSSPTRISPTTPGVLLGTLGYMAPEQVRGEPADARADLFAFGAVLLEMLTGARAFDGGSPAEAMSAILRDEPFIPRDIGAPPALIRLIRHCLEKRRDERAQSARDVLFVLESIDDLDRPAGVSGASSLSRAPAPSPAAASAASSPPTYRALTFRRGVVHNARFTPDGRMIVYSASWDGLARQMYLARLDGPESTALALPSADLMAVSSAGELLISLERRFIGNVYFSTGRLARAPMMGGAARELLDDVHEADWAPDGERLAVLRRVGSHMRLEYPIDTVRHTTDSWLAFIRVSPDGERVAFFEVWTSGMKTLRVLEPDGSTRVLAELRHWPGGLVWTPDGGELWFMEWGGPDGSMLRAIDLRGRLRTVSQMMGGYTVLHDLAADGSLLWTRGAAPRTDLVPRSRRGARARPVVVRPERRQGSLQRRPHAAVRRAGPRRRPAPPDLPAPHQRLAADPTRERTVARPVARRPMGAVGDRRSLRAAADASGAAPNPRRDALPPGRGVLVPGRRAHRLHRARGRTRGAILRADDRLGCGPSAHPRGRGRAVQRRDEPDLAGRHAHRRAWRGRRAQPLRCRDGRPARLARGRSRR